MDVATTVTLGGKAILLASGPAQTVRSSAARFPGRLQPTRPRANQRASLRPEPEKRTTRSQTNPTRIPVAMNVA